MAGVLSFDARTLISGNNYGVNVWHVKTAAGVNPTVAECNAILAKFKAFYDYLASTRAPGTVSIGTKVLWFDETWWTKPVGKPGKPGYEKGFFNTPPNIVGATPVTGVTGTGGLALPPQLAAVISWKTASAGRSYRGRTYVAQLGDVSRSGAAIHTATISYLNTAATNLITDVSGVTVAGGTVFLSVWSPTTGKAYVITSGSSDATWDTMRSRVK